MRLRANPRASRAARSKEANAAAISAGATRRPGGPPHIEPIELARIDHQCLVATRRYLGNNGARRLLHIRGALALGGEKRRKTRGEIRGFTVETDRHGLPPPPLVQEVWGRDSK